MENKLKFHVGDCAVCAAHQMCVFATVLFSTVFPQLVKSKMKFHVAVTAAHQIFCCCAPDVCDKLEAAVAEEVWQ